MYKPLLAGLAFAIPASLAAQSTVTWTMPKGFETTNGAYYHYHMGAYQDGRAQYICGDYQASGTVKSIKGLKFRRENYTTNYTNYARSWTNVTVSIADSDFQTITDRWALNMISPQVVFSSAMTFPGHTGLASSNPAPWGTFVATDDMDFPFTTVFQHQGKLGTTVDFQFSGGTLANNLAWGTTTARSYYVDGAILYSAAGNVWVEATQTGVGPTTCAATGQTSSSTFQSWLFSDNIVTGGQQHRVQFYGYRYPVSTVAMGVITFSGNTTGVSFAASCNLLYLDLSKPYVLYPFVSDSVGDYVGPFLKVPFVKGSIGTQVWTQAAFDDGTPVKVELTRGYYATVPAAPVTTTAYMAYLYHPDKTRSYGYGPYDYRLPVIGLY